MLFLINNAFTKAKQSKLYNILKGVKLFNLQFINKIKNKGTDKAFKKSQLII